MSAWKKRKLARCAVYFPNEGKARFTTWQELYRNKWFESCAIVDGPRLDPTLVGYPVVMWDSMFHDNYGSDSHFTRVVVETGELIAGGLSLDSKIWGPLVVSLKDELPVLTLGLPPGGDEYREKLEELNFGALVELDFDSAPCLWEDSKCRRKLVISPEATEEQVNLIKVGVKMKFGVG